VQTISQNLQGP